MAGNNKVIAQLKQFWASRNGRQRGFLIGGAVATAAILALFVKLIGTPDYKPLFTGLEPADAQALTAKLDAQGIPHQASADGKTISVPADKVDVARMQTVSDGQPRSGRLGFEIFDKMSWGQTEFDEKVAYQRAMEGELARSIQTLADVESARVHLVMPTDSVFLDRQRNAKASVILKLRRGTLSKSAALSISRLVASAVDELRPEDVSIVDADSDRSLGIGQDTIDGPNGSADLSQRLLSTLEPVIGAGKIRASVNVSYSQESKDQSEEKYDPTVSAVLNVQRTEDHAGGSAIPSGVPGTASNVPTASKPKPTSNEGETQTSKTETAQYGVNKTITHTISPAGQVDRLTAAILVDDVMVKSVQKGKVSYTRRKRTPEELNQIKELAEAAIGFDEKRGDSISVQNISFDADSADMDLPAPTLPEKVQKTVSQYSPALRPLSLLGLFLLVYFFMIRPVQKQALSATVELSAPDTTQELAAAPKVEALSAGTPEEVGAVRAVHLKEEAAEMIRQKPLHTTRAVQAWLREEPS